MKQLIINSKKHGEKTILYDDEDHKLISKYKWCVYKNGKNQHTFYAQAMIKRKNGKRSTISMHRLIMRFTKLEVDHKNRNGLDNRKCNLRKCTTAQNKRNSKMRKTNTSGYKGVTFSKQSHKYVAQLKFHYKHIVLGSFSTAKEAAKAYNNGALKYYEEFARINIIPS